MPRRQDLFTTITTQGALLPSDLLARVMAGDRSLEGLTPTDYHLNPGERFGEMVNRSWNRAVGAWAAFQDALARLPEGDPGTTVTRERWLLVLFQELGFGRLPAARAVEVGERSFPASHRWGPVPIHLVGARVDLDRRTSGIAGAARSSPHSLVQELLNASDEALWGIVGNGLKLRLLRDNAALTRQAFVEFDLESMMAGQVYADFVLLWMVLHQSRFEAENPADCWLERWAKEAEAQGTRALEHLREAVQHAIEALGRGYLAHQANTLLRDELRSGALGTQDYYRLLLRLVYRLLFLFVAEDRDLLLDPEAPLEARDRYQRFYSLDRLRRLAERWRGTQHADLYEALKLVMGSLWETGQPALAVPALGSFLWSPEAIGELGSSQIANRDLLEAIRALAFTRQEGVPRPIDYRNLGPEELGSVYESLLELHPRLNADGATFELATASGNERKTTGSYYTPTSLIVSLLDTALDPVLEEAVRKPDPEAAILDLKVVDPACGSGHFLLAAAQRMARRLASVRTGDEEPAPKAVRAALRQVIASCIYGVDLNPMAVELCKVGLWMESLVPGHPLSFLDHHVQCGNSLLGATPAMLAGGIPDEAFKPIEGDNKLWAASLRKRNMAERAGQMTLLVGEEVAHLHGPMSARMGDIDRLTADSIPAVREKERRYQELRASSETQRAQLAADAWCAAFVIRKTPDEPAITEEVRQRLGTDPSGVAAAVRDRIETLAEEYHLFHWHLAFPNTFRTTTPEDGSESGATGWSGGFDVVLGNPPWERVKLKEQEFFKTRSPEIAATPGAKRKRLIVELEQADPPLYEQYKAAQRRGEAEIHFVHDSPRYPLCGRGSVNTYSVFAETMRTLMAPTGRAGIIVPTGIATDDTTKKFFSSLVEQRSIASLYDFENAAPIFSHVHRSFKFCLMTMAGSSRSLNEGGEFVFFAHRVEDLTDSDRRFRLAATDFRLLNPNTRTCPIFRNRRDAAITRGIYLRVPVLVDRTRADGSPWHVTPTRMFHMTDDSALFRTRDELEAAGWELRGNVFCCGEDTCWPLYEPKMLHQFDHRWASYDDGTEIRELSETEKSDPERLVLPRYWIPQAQFEDRRDRQPWLLTWRKTARNTDVRTVIATLLSTVPVADRTPILVAQYMTVVDAAFLTANLTSFALDFVARTKLGGTDLSSSPQLLSVTVG
jgi:N-6 DNA Methylase